MLAVGAFTTFAVVADGYYRAVEEMQVKHLEGHMQVCCPNWVLGMATGAFGVGLLWWAFYSRSE